MAAITEQLCGTAVTSTQVSRAAEKLDEVLEAWRTRPLGKMVYLYLDARYEKVRMDGQIRDATILIASGVGRDGKRRILGVSVSLSEAEQHWRLFLEELISRGLEGVQLIISDDHHGLHKARQAVFTGIPLQRCPWSCEATLEKALLSPFTSSRTLASMSLVNGCGLRWQRTSGQSSMLLTGSKLSSI